QCTSGSITFGYDDAVTFAAGTSFTLEQYGYTFSATTTDKATTAVELTDTGISFTPGTDDGGLQVLLSKGDTTIFGGVLNVTGGTISFNTTTQKFSFTEGTNIALTLLNDTSRKFDIKVVDAAAAFRVEADTSGNLTITPDSGDGSLEVTYTLEGDTPISQTVKVSLDGSIVFNPATQSLTLTNGTTASVDLNNYTVTATATDDARVSISMTDSGLAITPQDGDGKLDVSVARNGTTVFSNTVEISGGSIVFNPATQALTITDGTSVSVVMNDYLALTATAVGNATSAISFTDGGISVTPNQGDGALDITLSTPIGSLPAGIEVLSGSFTLGQGGSITVAKDTEIQVSFFDEYIVNFKTTDDASVSISMTDAGFAITPQDGDGSLDVSITRGNALIFRNNISISNGSVVWNPVAQTMTLTDGTNVAVVMNDNYTLTMTADGDAASKVVLTGSGISVTPNQGDGTLDMSLTTPDGTLSAGIEVLNGSFTIKPGGAITVAKDTELQIKFSDDYIIGFKATNEAGGTIFLGAEGLTFTPGSDDGGLELSVTRGDTTRSASLDVTGTVTYKLDGSISLAQGTVVKNVFKSGNILTITANTDADGAIFFTPENGLTITPATTDALTAVLSTGDKDIVKVSSLDGTINYANGIVTASDGTKARISYYFGWETELRTDGGSASVQFTTDRTIYTANDGATFTVDYLDGDTTTEIQSGSYADVYGETIEDYVELVYEGTILKSNDSEVVFTLEKAGTYTLNGKTFTVSADNVTAQLIDYDKVILTGSDVAETISNVGDKITIQALGGDDFISNAESNTVSGGTADNDVNIVAGDGNDTIHNHHSYHPTLLGGAGDDSIVVSSGHYTFADGGDGNDTIVGTKIATPTGGWTMGGYATILGGAGDDLIDAGYSNNSSISGGTGDDTIVANGASATIDGGDGNNLIQLTTIDGGATGQYIVFSGNTTVEGFGTGFGEGTDTVYIAGDAPGCDFWTDGLALYNSTATLTFADVTTTAQLNMYYPNEDKMATEVLIADDEWYSVADGAASYYVGATAKLNHGINFNGISDALDVTLNTDYESTVASFWVNNVHSIIGGAGNSTITGSTLSDTIIAGDGATTINAGAGGDKLSGNGKTVFNVDTGATTTINGSAGDTINVGDDNYTFETDGTVYIAGGSLASYSRQTVLKSGDEYLTGDDNIAYANGNSITLTADNTELIVGKRGGTISGYDFNKTTYLVDAANVEELAQSVANDQIEFDEGTFHVRGQRDVVLEGVDTSKGTFLTFQANDERKILFGWSSKSGGLLDGNDIDSGQLLFSAAEREGATLRGGSKGDTIHAGESDVVSVSGGHDTVHAFANNGGDVTFDLGDGSTNGIMEVVDGLDITEYVVKIDDTDDLNLRVADDRLTFRKGNGRVIFDESTSFADANGLQVQVGDEVYTVRSDYSGGMSGVDYFWAGEGDLYYKPDTSLYLHDDGQTREYHITEGSGRATIDGFNHGVYGDTVFIDEIDNMRQVGDDVAIVSGSGDRVLIKDGANKIYNVVYDGSHYVAEIGSSLTYNAWVDVYGGGTGGNTVSVGADYSGNEVAVYMNGAAEVGGKEKYYFGVDKIDAAAYGGRASLIGGELNDTIIAAQGATSLWGGDGGDDVLHGTGTGNEFFYFRGNGRDVIRNAADGDVVNLYDVTLDDISATAINSSQASIEFKDGGSVTFDSAADATFKLGDGSTWKANHQSNEWQSQA
ncbi:MAG: hypothetical protein SR1Q7_08710, partial [Quinella sp. 1Q7]|nr:hypothetical protein [Quinella sp. 1Q7]